MDHYLIGDCTTDDALKGGGSEGDMAEMYDMEQFIMPGSRDTFDADANAEFILADGENSGSKTFQD